MWDILNANIATLGFRDLNVITGVIGSEFGFLHELFFDTCNLLVHVLKDRCSTRTSQSQFVC